MLPRVENGVNEVEIGCKRASVSARVATVAALVELPDGTGQSWGGYFTVLAMRYVQVRGM